MMVSAKGKGSIQSNSPKPMPPANTLRRPVRAPLSSVAHASRFVHLLPKRSAALTAVGAALFAISYWPSVRLAASELETKPAKGDAPTYTVKRAPLRTRVQLDGVLEAVSMSPVRVQGKTVNELLVVEAVPHGTRVKKGQVLIKVETDKLRDQIEDLELDRPASALALELTEAEVANLTQTTPQKLEAAKRAQRNATEDLAYFEAIGRASREKSQAFNVKGAEQRLDGAREELIQLKKMYDADDLTEETEEIILKRQKNAVESAEFYLENSRQTSDLSLKTTLPREHEALRTAKRDQDLAAGNADETLARTLAKKKLDLEKSKRDLKKSDKRLAELKKDLEDATITAPVDGIIYYGACEDGRWTTGAALAKRLVPAGKLVAREVVMTVVNPDKLILRAVVPEAELGKLKVGQEGHASPIASPDRKLSVSVSALGEAPLPGGGFESTLTVGEGMGARLMPGMNCKVTIDGARQENALVVPKEAVFSEGKEQVVYLAGKDRPEKRTVKTSGSDDRNIAILEGLEEGDKILTKKPE